MHANCICVYYACNYEALTTPISLHACGYEPNSSIHYMWSCDLCHLFRHVSKPLPRTFQNNVNGDSNTKQPRLEKDLDVDMPNAR